MAEQLKDFRGKTIAAGACVVYAVKQSTSVKMVEGIVEAVIYKPAQWNPTPTPRMLPVLVIAPTRRGNSEYYEKQRTRRTVEVSNVRNVVVLVEAK